MIVIVYTTKYRLGGAQFEVVAQTMAAEMRDSASVLCRAVESKSEVKAIFAELTAQGIAIDAFHFIGHSGMYGPMFGTVKYPEQFSPWEWQQLSIPFAKQAEATFHCCRSARWFAPFFANAFGVPTYGYHWYTAFSKVKKKYKAALGTPQQPLYCFGCPGKKSHGYGASVRKFTGNMPAEPLKKFTPDAGLGDATYNKVASLYAAAFQNIRVREDEWEWLEKHFPQHNNIRQLDIGCGNGALLNALAPQIAYGAGVDESTAILEHAKQFNAEHSHLEFAPIDGPKLPFPDNHFNVVTSLLSFRYLDWDPLLEEIERVLVPEGKLLIIDMVTAPVKWGEYPQLLGDKLKQRKQRKKYPSFHKALAEVGAHPNWKKMLEYNPIRSEHEMKWYLESRFPYRKANIINLGYNARMLAFDSGEMRHLNKIKLSYP